MNPFVSIITVCLNAGPRLLQTVESGLAQSFSDFEIIIKDGLSQDGSLDRLPADPRIRVVRQKDCGIYDAMNQALQLCRGKYVNFLNAGDVYTSPDVLAGISGFVGSGGRASILYSYYQDQKTESLVRTPRHLSRFYLFRKTVCHQAMFVKADLFTEIGLFNPEFPIKADHEFLLRALQGRNAAYCLVPLSSVIFEGNGISSVPANWPVAGAELKRIQRIYFSKRERMWYGFIHALSLYSVRIRLLARIQSKRVHRGYIKAANWINGM